MADNNVQHGSEDDPNVAPGSEATVSAVDLDQTALNESSEVGDPSGRSVDMDSVDNDIAEAYARDVGTPTDTSSAFIVTDDANSTPDAASTGLVGGGGVSGTPVESQADVEDTDQQSGR